MSIRIFNLNKTDTKTLIFPKWHIDRLEVLLREKQGETEINET